LPAARQMIVVVLSPKFLNFGGCRR
jgi:hypothetical protein